MPTKLPRARRLTNGATLVARSAALTLLTLSLTAPREGVSQAPAASNDTLLAARETPVADHWYPEGSLRIRRKRYSLFVGATFTQFTSANARSRFGTGTVSPSIELYRPQHGGFSPVFEFNDTRIESGDSMARIVALTAGVRYRPVDAAPSRWLVPFVSIGAGPRWARASGTVRTAVVGAGIHAGLELVRTVRFTARYEALPVVHGHQLSAMAFGVAFRLPPYRSHVPRTDNADGTAHQATCAGLGCAR